MLGTPELADEIATQNHLHEFLYEIFCMLFASGLFQVFHNTDDFGDVASWHNMGSGLMASNNKGVARLSRPTRPPDDHQIPCQRVKARKTRMTIRYNNFWRTCRFNGTGPTLRAGSQGQADLY